MNDVNVVVDQLHLLWLLGIAAFLWFVGWRRYRLDVFRQNLFALRDELFDLAADGHVEFNDFAYGGMRQLINGMIRFGHRVTFMRVVILSVCGPEAPAEIREPYHEWKARVDTLPPDARGLIDDLHHRVLFQMVEHIVATSPLLLLTLGFVLCTAPLFIGATRVTNWVARQAMNLPGIAILEEEAEALEYAA